MSAVSLLPIARSNVVAEVQALYAGICERELEQLWASVRGRFAKGVVALVPIVLAMVLVGHFWMFVIAGSFWFVVLLMFCEPLLNRAKQIRDRRDAILQDLRTIRWMIDGGGACALECSASHPADEVVELRVEVVTPDAVTDGIKYAGRRKSTACPLGRHEAVAIMRKFASMSEPPSVDGCDRIPQK